MRQPVVAGDNGANGATHHVEASNACPHAEAMGAEGGATKRRTLGGSQLCCDNVAKGVAADAAEQQTVGGVGLTRGKCASGGSQLCCDDVATGVAANTAKLRNEGGVDRTRHHTPGVSHLDSDVPHAAVTAGAPGE